MLCSGCLLRGIGDMIVYLWSERYNYGWRKFNNSNSSMKKSPVLSVQLKVYLFSEFNSRHVICTNNHCLLWRTPYQREILHNISLYNTNWGEQLSKIICFCVGSQRRSPSSLFISNHYTISSSITFLTHIWGYHGWLAKLHVVMETSGCGCSELGLVSRVLPRNSFKMMRGGWKESGFNLGEIVYSCGRKGLEKD